jgi:hypothetical protein
VGHKLINCPRFGEMQNVLKDNGGQTIESKLVDEVKAITAFVNMVDVNVTIQNKASEKQVFKDRKPMKNKFATDWEVEERLKRFMVETI